MPPRRESLARATALYLERKATSEAGTPAEASTPVAVNSRTPIKSPYRSNSSGACTAAVGIRSLPTPPPKTADANQATAQGQLPADSTPRRLFKNRSDGGLASSAAAADAGHSSPRSSIGAAAAAAPDVSENVTPAAVAEVTGVADGIAEVSLCKAAADLHTPVKAKQQEAAQAAHSLPGKAQAQTEPKGRRTSVSRRGSAQQQQQQQQQSPRSLSSRLFHSPQSSRQSSMRRGSESDKVSVKSLSAGFDAAAGAAAGAGSVRAYRARSDAGAGAGNRSAGGAAVSRSGSSKWQQLGAGLSPESSAGRVSSKSE
jgi:hypothetical protein